MADPDKPNNLLIAGLVAGIIVVVSGLVFGVDQMFRSFIQEEISVKVLAAPNSKLRELRAEEEARLTQYQWVDQKAGLVRIPIEQAMTLTVRDWKNRPTTPVLISTAQGSNAINAAPTVDGGTPPLSTDGGRAP